MSALICFDSSSGKPIPRLGANDDPDGWRNARALSTIEYYHLDEGTWNAKREDLMRDVGVLCDKMIAAKAEGDAAGYDTLINEVADLVGPWAEFSSAAVQAFQEKGVSLVPIATGV